MYASLIGVFFFIVVAAFRFVENRKRNLPPGPQGWPIVGNLPALTDDPPKKILEWSKQYGPTVSITVGGKTQVILHDYDTMKSVFSTENLTGRDHDFIVTKQRTRKGFMVFEGEIWRQHRRFALSALRDLGMGKGWLEDAILDEVNDVIKLYSSQNGKPYNPRSHLTLSISNVICAMAFGKRFDHKDENFLRLCGLFSESTELLSEALPASTFPILQYLPTRASRAYKKMASQIKEIEAFIEQLVEDHIAAEKDSDGNRDFIDFYMSELEEHKNDPKSTFSLHELLGALGNLFIAGTDTSTVTILWCMVYMIENPDVLAKVHEEIESKVGRDRPIRMPDKALLNYTEAVLLEVQRLATIVPLGVAHTNLEAMKIDGYDIPARTVIQASAYAAHRDPKLWKHPEQFYPEHFLDKNGAVVIPKGFMPFGVGKRMCLGEGLGKMNVFLYFTNIVQKFSLQSGPTKVSSQNYITPFVRMPKPFEVCFIPW